MMEVGVNACTDITGFGLLGHLHSMMKASGTAARLSRSAIPVLPGVQELLEQDVAPGGTHRNIESLEGHIEWDDTLPESDRLLLCDPQTSGGMLVCIPAEKCDLLIENLVEQKTLQAAIVGEVADGDPGTISIKP